jgi:hypothetical protein
LDDNPTNLHAPPALWISNGYDMLYAGRFDADDS